LAITRTLCLVAKHRSGAESINMTLTEYAYRSRKRSNNGSIICYFDRKSTRLLSSDVGHIIIRRLSSLMSVYLVIAGDQIITVGHRYKRMKNL
jgi:hypothetical protein